MIEKIKKENTVDYKLTDFFTWLNEIEDLKYTEKDIKFHVEKYLKEKRKSDIIKEIFIDKINEIVDTLNNNNIKKEVEWCHCTARTSRSFVDNDNRCIYCRGKVY